MSGLRAGVRIPVEFPVQLRWRNRTGMVQEAQGVTENISGNGSLLRVPVRLRRQTPITFTVAVPAEVTKVPLELACQGRVVRCMKPGDFLALAATIDQYELRPAQRAS